jgi:hypothetical protein
MKFKTATCKRTGHSILLSDGFFVANPGTAEWSFVAIDAPESHGDYNVAVASLTKSPEAFVDWIAHLNEKTWFDAKKFADFFTRFRKENDLYGSL